MNGLSIIIPTFNDECIALVKDLQSQCEKLYINGNVLNDYEIIVGDDGSTDDAVITINQEINTLPHCKYIRRKENKGRAAVRNFLAKEAKYNKVLLIDCGRILIRKDFIKEYLKYDSVVYGGYDVPSQPCMSHNLRYRYERACLPEHTTKKRQLHPYQNFNTCNVLIPKDVILAHPFNEDFRHYGYEDVAYGDELRKSGVKILHIDNPMGLCHFEPNDLFVSKTEESIRTLVDFRRQLKGYSRLLDAYTLLKRYHLQQLFYIFLKPLMPAIRRQLRGNNPFLLLFKIYKIEYLLYCMNKVKSKKSSECFS